MDRSHMNGSFSRPYQSTCGMQFDHPGHREMNQKEFKSSRENIDCSSSAVSRYEILKPLSLAMAYVPKQRFYKTFDHSTALDSGTIFPELCKPFCGKRGVKRC